MARIFASSEPGAISAAAAFLREGGLVAFPTETVYGLGADALNPKAVARVFETKGRPRFDPLIVHVADFVQLGEIIADFPLKAQALAKRFWPGPLTLVLPKKNVVPDIVTAGLKTVAVRIPAHPVALDLIRAAQRPIAAPSANRFGRISPTCAAAVKEELGESVDVVLDLIPAAQRPIAAPSANRFGRISPTCAAAVKEELGESVDVVLDGGPCRVGVESTIISFADREPLLLRPGGVGAEEIETIVGPLLIPDRTEARPLSPGRLPRHYAPRTPLVLWSGSNLTIDGKRIGLLTLQSPLNQDHFVAVEVLSKSGDLHEAAANLFAAMRRLDSLGLDLILAYPVPNHGVGLAINDRLLRASIDSHT